ncbi:MAG: glycosyltransferase family 39 protein [Alphaproteobacteria bacterium]|nr:glycosyltransferase family 39 protein [Alphaproteobacteria bacterium]
MTAKAHSGFAAVLAIVAALTALRVALLVLTPLQLYPDEAQYWWWAQSPALGYFSKPPMIAWLIRLTTALFGEGEWAIRLAAPLLHGGTALLLYGIGKRTGGDRIGIWSALAYATVPGVSYSCGLISTDVPLLFCWAVALYAFLAALEDQRWRWPLLCGVGLGLGLLSKYAMLYFVVGMILSMPVSPRARALLLGRRGAAIAASGLLLFLPNLLWDQAHGFVTVTHIAADADWRQARFRFLDTLEFLGGQFGVFGPLLMAGFLLALWRLARRREVTLLDSREHALVLAAFALPPLLAIVVQAFMAGANANWAAPAYVSAVPLAVAVLLAMPRRWGLKASFAVNLFVMAGFWLVLLQPALAETMGVGNAFKREEGWRGLGQAVLAAAQASRYDAIAAANRSVMAELTYYARPRALPLRMWSRGMTADNYFRMTIRLTPASRRVLLVLLPGERQLVLPTFESSRPLGTVSLAVGGGHLRVAALFDACRYRGIIRHVPNKSDQSLTFR